MKALFGTQPFLTVLDYFYPNPGDVIPDYERYLAHVAEHHAGESVLSRRDFFIRSIDRKYGRSGPRCR
jgi:putative selenoprotein